jgi:hypothetical protein
MQNSIDVFPLLKSMIFFCVLTLCRKLSRNLKYNSDVPSMAEAVMRFHDTELSWDELKDLAAPYIKGKWWYTLVMLLTRS